MDIQHIKKFEIFTGISEPVLDAIARSGSVADYETGEDVFVQGGPADTFYGLLSGEIDLALLIKDEVTRHSIEHEESIVRKLETLERMIVVDTVSPGEVFGWTSLADADNAWTASARCVEPSRVFSVSASFLLDLFEKDTASGYLFQKRLGALISLRLRHRTDKLIDIWVDMFEHPKV